MVKELYGSLRSQRDNWKNETELQQCWVGALGAALGIVFHAERGRKDSSYNNVVIEFKKRGRFKGRPNSPAFREAINDRLLPYITKTAKEEKNDQSDYIGIAIDGDHICFAQVKEGTIKHGPLLELSEESVSMVVTAIQDQYRRTLNAPNLIEDFGHSSKCGKSLLVALSDSFSRCINDRNNNKTKMLFEEWRTLFGQVADLTTEQMDNITNSIEFSVNVPPHKEVSGILFVIHTYNSLLIKLLAAEIISSYDLTTHKFFAQNLAVKSSSQEIISQLENEIEGGSFFSGAGINGFVEEALFSWYIDECKRDNGGPILSAIKEVLINLSLYRTDNLSKAQSNDLLKLFYQNIVPETLRKSLGEFYTPDWLVEFTLQKANTVDWLNCRCLDPTCGSGSFLLEIIRRKVQSATASKWCPAEIIKHVTENVWGFDLNPLAVQTARVNYLISIADVLKLSPGQQIEIPILLADAVYSPSQDTIVDGIVHYSIGSKIADLEITLPQELAFNRTRLDVVFREFGEQIEAGCSFSEATEGLMHRNLISQRELSRWKEPLRNTYEKVLRLHKNDWNGIWFRIVKNFFWSSIAGSFDLIAGNPPWVRWSKLPELYRERVKETCMKYDIFSESVHYGGNELDISAMITYTVADKWLANGGTLAFVITQTHFQSPSSSGFRKFKINNSHYLNPISVDDFQNLKPFPDAANKTAVAIFQKGDRLNLNYPLPYTIWNTTSGFARKIPVALSLMEILGRIQSEEWEANPVEESNSPWAILPKGRFQELKGLTGKSNWVNGRKGITADINGIYFVDIIERNEKKNLVKIKNRPEAGRKKFGPSKELWVEPDLLFPLIKGASDFSKCHLQRDHSLYAFVPNHGINRKNYDDSLDRISKLPKSRDYFLGYKDILENRSSFRGRMTDAPYFAIYNVGDYTFSPWKVIWAEQKTFCAVVVSTDNNSLSGNDLFVADHKVYFVNFDSPEPAYYLCGLLNSETVIEFVNCHNISIQIGNIFKHMNLPKFDPKNKIHKKLVSVCMRCHTEENSEDRDKLLGELSKIAKEIIGF